MRTPIILGLSAALLLPAVAAHAGWRDDAPGVAHRLSADTLPAPFTTRSESDFASIVDRPAGASLHVPPGFDVSVYVSGLNRPRTLRTAPNGDVFVAESGGGRIRVLRPAAGGAAPATVATFAAGLNLPFGIAFWPPQSPRFVYVAETDRVLRYPYVDGDLQARGPAVVVIAGLPEGGHWTRDIVFSPDGTRLFVSVGSGGNIAAGLTGPPPAGLAFGAAWDDDRDRADVLAFGPDGQDRHVYATGLRNCSAEAIQPASGALWCAVNERDGMGDDLPPDFVTRVDEGAFYGWPWFYIGGHPDPRLRGARADLAGHVRLPDVLIQPHSAPLGLTFYDGTQFPPDYRGDAFAALHGSWNRAERTGYKVVRIRFLDGRATGAYEDFLTGFIVSDQAVWGRPVGVAVAKDGALLVSEDANGTIWRIGYLGRP